jgi:hypothetical protein
MKKQKIKIKIDEKKRELKKRQKFIQINLKRYIMRNTRVTHKINNFLPAMEHSFGARNHV